MGTGIISQFLKTEIVKTKNTMEAHLWRNSTETTTQGTNVGGSGASL